MNKHSHKITLVALLSCLGISSCTTESPPYQTPTRLCNADVSDTSIQPLLPSGNSVKVRDRTVSERLFSCSISVDDHRAMTVHINRVREAFDPVKEGSALYDYSGLEEISFDGRAAVANEGAVASILCHSTGERPYLSFDIFLYSPEDSLDVSRADIEQFLREFVPAIKDRERCTE